MYVERSTVTRYYLQKKVLYLAELYTRSHRTNGRTTETEQSWDGIVLRWARAIQLSTHCMYGSRCSWQTSAKLTPQFPTSTEQLRQQNLGEREKENIQVYILRADVWTWHHWDVCTYAHASPQHTQTTTPALVYIYIYIYI